MFETKHHFFIITDLYSGGDLFSELEDEGVFSEYDAAQLMNTMLTCMNYCHQRGLVHLDLKPENILLPGRGRKDYTNVKIIDFGTFPTTTTTTTWVSCCICTRYKIYVLLCIAPLKKCLLMNKVLICVLKHQNRVGSVPGRIQETHRSGGIVLLHVSPSCQALLRR